MNNVAFACPLYDMKNHFELALNLYKSKVQNNIKNDFYFIFSDIEQKNKFEKLLSAELPEEHLLYLVTTEKINKCKAKAVSKKFFALESLKDKYDYIILTDCEALFIKDCDYGELAEDIWKNRTMLNSNKSPDGFFIMRKCFKTMGLYENKKLKKDTCNFIYNFWFNELQVYKCDNLTRFFQWLDQYNKTQVYDEYSCFEYYVYYAFLLLEEDIHIRKFKYESMGGINEYLYRFPINEQKQIMNDMGFHWSSSRNAINSDTVMLFHLDREGSTDYSPMLTPKIKLKYFKDRMRCHIKDFLHYD